MRIPCCLLTILSLVLFLSTVKSQSWLPVGANDFTEANVYRSRNTSIAVYGGVPYIAYRNLADTKLSVRKFTGNAWQFVGPEGFDNCYDVSFAIDASGTPYVAYGNPSNGNKVTVKAYDGSGWVDVGTPAALTGTTAYNCVIGIAANGTIYLAFADGTNGNKLGVRMKAANGDWTDLTPGGITASTVSNISMALDGADNAYIAFADNNSGNGLTVIKYTGSFSVVGTAGFSNGSISNTSMVLDAAGTPYVACSENSNNGKIAVKKFDGTNWVIVGTRGFSIGLANSIVLKIAANGNLYVVYGDASNSFRTTVKIFDGSSWADAGGPVESNTASYQNIALDAAGIPYIVYTQSFCNDRAIVKKLTGNSWVIVGTEGVTNGPARLPQLVTNSSGMPYIAYFDQYSSENNIVIKYDGNSWMNVGQGLPLAGIHGLRIAMDANDVPYVLYVSQNELVNVKKFDGSDWIDLVAPGTFAVLGGVAYAFTVSANGTPYIAYTDKTTQQLNVKKVDGGSWVTVGTANFSSGRSSNICIALDGNGVPFVLYNDGTLASVKKLDGSNWVDVGMLGVGSINPPANIEIDGNNTPYVGYYQSGTIKVKKFDGNNWINVGTLGAGQTFQDLAINGNNVPYLIYTAGNITGVKKFDGNNWVDVGIPGITAAPASIMSLDFDANGEPVVGYASGGIYVKRFDPMASLPLHLTAFNGRIDNTDALLHWQSEEEINTRSFIIERSIDGRTYNAAGTVTAINESGAHPYSFVDKNVDKLGASVIYYRLKQVDINGQSTYSHVLMLPVKQSANSVICYPNPVTSETNLNITLDKGESVQARIIDNLGKVIQVRHWNLSAGTTSVPVDMSRLVKGMYYLEISGRSIKKQVSLIKL